RCSEVTGVIAACEVLGQIGIEVDNDLVSNLTQVDMSVRVRQANHDAAGAILTAAEVDAADGAGAGSGHGGTAAHGGSGGPGADGGVVGSTQADDDVVSIDAGVIGHQLVEIHHQARAILGLGGQNRVHAGGVDVDAARRQ